MTIKRRREIDTYTDDGQCGRLLLPFSQLPKGGVVYAIESNQFRSVPKGTPIPELAPRSCRGRTICQADVANCSAVVGRLVD